MKTALKKLKIIIPYIFIVLSSIIFCIIYYILKVLKKVNTYELYYYFKSETTGTASNIILDGIKLCLPLLIILIILFILPISNFKKFNIKIKNINILPNKLNKHKIIYSLIILLISILALLKTINFDKFYVNTLAKTDIYEKYYKDTNEVDINFTEKRNLILIYLESMETSLVSKENGGYFKKSRIPELETLALENINFSNTEKLGGAYHLTSTGWTIASAVASTSGTPLMTTIRNRYNNLSEIMPEVNTLGDVLKKEGYNLEIIQGSNINFSGTKTYYKNHGNYKILDYKEAKKQNLIPENYKKWWGFEDKKVFEFSKNEITNLSKENTPFAVSIFTMDTHFKDGYLDETCATPFADQYSNVYACSSKMVNDFINWLKEQDFYENTTIVLIGDHLTMQSSFYENDSYQRTIYNAFINTNKEPINTKNRLFTSLDMYPTILSSIGAEIKGEQLGFGVNLFSNEKTLIEKLDRNYVDEELGKSSDYYNEHILNYKSLENLNKKKIESDSKYR